MTDATARTGSSTPPEVDGPARTTSSAPAGPDSAPHPVHVSIPTVCVVGSAAWLVVLVVTLAVPALHAGERSWWPWTAVVGLVLGVAGWGYTSRGRGNAASA